MSKTENSLSKTESSLSKSDVFVELPLINVTYACNEMKMANTGLQLVVMKDYESAFDSVTLMYIPYIVSLADFQLLSIAKINIFH